MEIMEKKMEATTLYWGVYCIGVIVGNKGVYYIRFSRMVFPYSLLNLLWAWDW